MKGDLSDMWRQAAEFHIKNGHPNVAANSLEELLRSNPNDKKTIAQLVLAYSQVKCHLSFMSIPTQVC